MEKSVKWCGLLGLSVGEARPQRVVLTDEAFVQQNGNTLSAEVITYNTITKKMIASAVPGKRVRSVIYPDKISQKKK